LDRLWIVNDVAEKVIESGGNVAESKAAKLGQYFSITMLVEVHGDKGGCADEMRSLLSSLPDLNVAVFEAKETAAAVPSVACKSNHKSPHGRRHAGLRCRRNLTFLPVCAPFEILSRDLPLHRIDADTGHFSLEGADNPGIVHTITSAMAAHGLSIERMETGQELAPMGGTTLFRMTGVCHAFEPLPAGFDSDAVRRELEALGESLNCEVTMDDDADDASSSSFGFE
jgi:glycine cleavage system regulatory protein